MIRAVVDGPCKLVRCYVDIVLVRKGWICHCCQTCNEPGVRICGHIGMKDGEEDWSLVGDCEHKVCELCEKATLD